VRHGLLKFWVFSPHRKGVQYPTVLPFQKHYHWILTLSLKDLMIFHLDKCRPPKQPRQGICRPSKQPRQGRNLLREYLRWKKLLLF